MADSAEQVSQCIQQCWQLNETFESSFARNYPTIIKVDLSLGTPSLWLQLIVIFRLVLVDPYLDYSEFLGEALGSIEEASSSVHYECRSDDSFSSIMAKILPQLGIHEEFCESAASMIEKSIGKLFVCLRNSHRIRGSVLETVLEYFRQFTGVVFIIDAAVAYERLSAKFKYSCPLIQPQLINSSEALFQKFIVYLIDYGFKQCILTPDVLDFISSQCAAAQLALPLVQRIVKYCVYRTLGSSIHLTQIPTEILASQLPADEAQSIMTKLNSLSSEIVSLAQNNVIIFQVIRCISETLKTPFELVKETLIPGFGTKAFFDRYYDNLKRKTPDEFVQILLRMKQSLEKFKGQLVQVFNGLGGRETNGIKSQADVNVAVQKLQELVSLTEYFNTDHPLLSFAMFYDVGELESLFFTDIGKIVQGSLKYPEQYMPTPKSNGRLSRNRPRKLSVNTASIPDPSRLYKLTLEWQRMINLHDLYFQFQSQIHSGPKKPTSEQQKGYMARFMQAVNEMELVGVWSSHGRKRDTYERRNFTDAPDEDLIDII